MKHAGNCRFCDINFGEYKFHGVDEPFAENRDYFAVASIGAFIEGWTLIVPKKHQLSMRNCFDDQNMVTLVSDVSERLMRQYGSVVTFEHGSNAEGSATACGTDHAHLHLVPLKESLVSDLNNSGMDWLRCSTSEIVSIAGDKEYLFYADLKLNSSWVNPEGYLHVLERPISQYFRQLLAKRFDCSAQSDYKLFPFLQNSIQTRSALAV